MTNEDVKRITKAFDERFKLLLTKVARIKTEVSDSKTTQFRNYTELSRIGKDIGRIDSTLETLSEDSGKNTKKLDVLWEQTDELTKDINEVKETLESHTNTLKQIVINTTNRNDNIKRLDKRLTENERSLGIVPPPELTI